MKKRYLIIMALLLAMLTGCGASDGAENSDNKRESGSISIDAEDSTSTTADSSAPAEKVTAPVEEVGYDGMLAVYGDSLKDGEYSITVDSSSSMFNITDCVLTVENGVMTAEMTMGGTGYLYLYMGNGDDAATASEEEYIPFTDNGGVHSFTVPVEALDMETDCAAFSKKKEEWYDRKLVFRADSLPAEAFADGAITTAESLELADGEYTVEVTLEGGSGKASVQSPARLTVENGKATALLVWSSKNYDYMVVDGEKYLPIEGEETAVFEIPVTGFDRKVPVSADTTAMSVPHEIEYTLYFDSTSVSEQ